MGDNDTNSPNEVDDQQIEVEAEENLTAAQRPSGERARATTTASAPVDDDVIIK